jgi:hypothetical protein
MARESDRRGVRDAPTAPRHVETDGTSELEGFASVDPTLMIDQNCVRSEVPADTNRVRRRNHVRSEMRGGGLEGPAKPRKSRRFSTLLPQEPPSKVTDCPQWGQFSAQHRGNIVARHAHWQRWTKQRRGARARSQRRSDAGADNYIVSMESPVDRRHRRLWTVVVDRTRLAAQLESTLCKLGLERRAKAAETLSEYLARREAGHGT